MRQKQLIFFLVFILIVSSVIAIKPAGTTQASTTSSGTQLLIEYPKQPNYYEQDSMDLYFHVFWNNGTVVNTTQVSCLLHVYNATGVHLLERWASMDVNGMDYEVVLGENITRTQGYYAYIFQCNSSTQLGFVSDLFEIGTKKEFAVSGSPLAVVIVMPLIMGLIFLLAAFLLNPEEHFVLRIFLMLMSFMSYFASAWLGFQALIKYYGFGELQDSSTFLVWIFGIVLFVILSYFVIYAFYKSIKAAAQEKDEMMLK